MIPPKIKGNVKRTICRIAGHKPGEPYVNVSPNGRLRMSFITCSRCGHMLSMEEDPLWEDDDV